MLRFKPGARPVGANVLFSREHPGGVVARFEGANVLGHSGQAGHQSPGFGAVANLRFDADFRDARGVSAAWQPGAQWASLLWTPLHVPPGLAAGAPRFVAPYPASLLKLLVAVGLGLAIDAGRLGWAEALPALEPMIVVSDNDATDRCVALLHRAGWVDALNRTLQQAWGLPTLQLHSTTAQGGWRNGDGAGVGHIHMTAWDTVRLLWLLDADAPPPPWLAPAAPRLQAATQRRLMAVLAAQQLDEILSSGKLKAVPGWVRGLPDAPAFAHKTGTTENYASDAGIVKAGGAHYAIALLSNLGSRYAAPDPGQDRTATTWKLPALGAAVHARLIAA